LTFQDRRVGIVRLASGTLPLIGEEAFMVDACVECGGPLSGWAGPLVTWLEERGVCPERSARTVRTFARFSSWMSVRGLRLADLGSPG
jgi:hypothetical protein